MSVWHPSKTSTFAVLACLAAAGVALRAAPAQSQETIDVGETGFDLMRPVLASACEHGCPWGELGEFVQEAMEPMGYEVILCRNCNRAEGPRIVADAARPPEITAVDIFVGTTTRVDAPVDFGITESSFLAWAYHGRHDYESDGPYPNLRLIAKIEDPFYLLAAVKADSDIEDLGDIVEQQLPVRVLGAGSPHTQPVLDHYGLTREALMSWGGTFGSAIGQTADAEFDVVLNALASPANNPESSYWPAFAHRYELRFLDLPDELLDELAADEDLGFQRVTAKWGLLPGVDRAIETVARSGEAVFAREDTPEQAAYDAAKAIDEHRAALKWFIRPYSYDSRTVWENFDVPLHPGAERYYREMGYLRGEGQGDADPGAGEDEPDAVDCSACPAADAGPAACEAEPRDDGQDASASNLSRERCDDQDDDEEDDDGCGCRALGRTTGRSSPAPLVAAALLVGAYRLRRRRRPDGRECGRPGAARARPRSAPRRRRAA